MKNITIYIALVIQLISLSGNSQNFSGQVFYKAILHENNASKTIKTDSVYKNKINKELDQIIARGKDLILQLDFDQTSSFYANRFDPINLDAGEELEYKMTKLIYNVKNEYYFFKNDQKLIEKNNMLGEVFLVLKDNKINTWKLLNEKKKLGIYECFKAERIVDFITRKGVQKTRKQIVWYTLDIPVPYGPNDFVGFPGLVLQVIDNDGSLEYTVDKIFLNPRKKVEIKKESGGKYITENEFKKMFENYNANTKKMLGI